MQYWLVKSEPEAYSYEDLLAEKQTMWDGVRNYAARNHMRSMKNGDLVLFYHSRQGLEVVAVTKVVKEFYPDPTAEKGDWSVVDIVPLKRLNKPVPLTVIKTTPGLEEMIMVKNSRLSVMPVEKKHFDLIMSLGETTL